MAARRGWPIRSVRGWGNYVRKTVGTADISQLQRSLNLLLRGGRKPARKQVEVVRRLLLGKRAGQKLRRNILINIVAETAVKACTARKPVRASDYGNLVHATRGLLNAMLQADPVVKAAEERPGSVRPEKLRPLQRRILKNYVDLLRYGGLELANEIIAEVKNLRNIIRDFVP